MRCIRILVADRCPLVRRGLLDVLDVERDFRVVACCGDALSSVEAMRKLQPEIAILDAAFPDLDGAEVLAKTSSENIPTRIVFFTTSGEDPDTGRLAEAGAYAVISKDIEPVILMRILRQVADNATSLRSGSELSPTTVGDGRAMHVLTHRERQIIRLVSEGLSNKEIGRQLDISDGTIRVHLHKIFQKLEVTNRTALAALAISQDP
jgi:two-component system, NarL family, nitrate/nitrite response regulator NarL